MNEDNNVDADTSLADLDISRLNDIEIGVNTAKLDPNNDNKPSIFPANNLLRKTANNLAKAEAMVDEKPLRTKNTIKVENTQEN